MKAKLEFVIPRQTTPKAPTTTPVTQNRSITPAGWIPPKNTNPQLASIIDQYAQSQRAKTQPSTPYVQSQYDIAKKYAEYMDKVGGQPIMNLEQAVQPNDQGGGGSGNSGSGSGSGGSKTPTSDQADYAYLTDKAKDQYKNSLAKYDLQVQQAMEDTAANNRSSYISMMQQNRVAGAQQQSQGMAGSGYANVVGKRIDQNFFNSKESARTNYNRTIDDINQAIADTAFNINQSLSDTYRTYKDANVTKQTVSVKKYNKR